MVGVGDGGGNPPTVDSELAAAAVMLEELLDGGEPTQDCRPIWFGPLYQAAKLFANEDPTAPHAEVAKRVLTAFDRLIAKGPGYLPDTSLNNPDCAWG